MTEKRTWLHLYKSAAWRRLRGWQLSEHPLCAFCLEDGRVTAATVADHRVNHKGDVDLFHDPDNLQSLCASHHNSTKQRLDHGKTVIRFGADGYPI